MASPIHQGTMMSTPFISQYVGIIKEKIRIIPDHRFETAQFIIEYQIEAHRSGTQIPLLFYASDFKEDFLIWIDEKEIHLSPAPEAYKTLEGSPFSDFGYLFATGDKRETGQVLMATSPSSSFYVSIDDLKFFEVDLSEGRHLIQVKYTADNWTDDSDWVKEYSFRYVLSPARYWKTFGALEIELDASSFDGTLNTNLSRPTRGDLGSKAVWNFTSLPVDVLQISYKPRVSSIANILMAISPAGLAALFAVLLIILHVISLKRFRRANPDQRFSRVVIVGSILVPLLILLGYIFAFELIDSAIGREAGRYHGYTFLVLLLYPILLPVYWIIMWRIDRMQVLKTNNNGR